MPVLWRELSGNEMSSLRDAGKTKEEATKMTDEHVIEDILKELDKTTELEARAKLISDACLDIAGMESITRAMWIKQLAKKSKLALKTIESKVREKEKILDDDTPIAEGEVDELFDDPELLSHILQDIDADHKLDHYEKAALFLVRLTGELPNPSDRKSAALKGDSSSGKDNITRAVLKRFPSESNKVLTHTTAAALRRSVDKVRCYAFSEINAHRENGANKDIVETLKQLAEDGIKAELVDKDTHEVIKLESEQKTLIYGTTEIESDEELATRYVVISISSDKQKNETVVKDVLRKAANPWMVEHDVENWCSRSIRLLDHELDIIIPFCELLGEEIDDGEGGKKKLFDYSKDRVKRDAKRLLCLAKGVTWLYQKQRHIVEREGRRFLVMEPSDFLAAYEIVAPFFNLTYTGLDHRLEACYRKVLEMQGRHDDLVLSAGYGAEYFGWVPRHKLAEELGIPSTNTIKDRIKKLKDFQLVETHYEYGKPSVYLVKGIKMGVNRVSLPIKLTPLTSYLTPYLTPSRVKDLYGEKLIRPVVWKFEGMEKEYGCVFSEIDTHQIDTLPEHTPPYVFEEAPQ